MQKEYWPAGSTFIDSELSPWFIQNNRVGQYRSYPAGATADKAKLYQAIIDDAGHLVPKDQPDIVLHLFNTFIGKFPKP